MRKLASVQKIKEILPIEGADRIELAKVLGWQCVVKKGEFREGDDCVYFEIDSFLPIREEFEFLRASSYKKSDVLGDGFRLKTQKMRGQISQGLCLPISILDDTGWHGLPEGTDVTEILGVRKWEIPEMATSGGTIVGQLLGWMNKTDETRIQNVPDIIDEFDVTGYYITTKMDGSSHAIAADETGFHAFGHNYEYKDDGKSSFYEWCKRRELDKKLVELRKHAGWNTVAIYGEYCGPGMQKNRLKLQSPEWYVFTMEIDGKRMPWDTMVMFAENLKIETVPLEESCKVPLKEKYPTSEAILARADGCYGAGGPKEGIVIRPLVPVESHILQAPLSVKVINNKYLLKEA